MSAYIVGYGHTPFGKLDALGLEDLITLAASAALTNAGVDAAEIDAVWLGHFNSGLVPDAFAASMILHAHPGLRFKPAIRCENACASGSAAIFAALDAVNSGRCRLALVVGAEKMTGLDTEGVTRNQFKLAMAVGNSRKYRIFDIHGRHFVETGRAAGLSVQLIGQAITEIREMFDEAFSNVERLLPGTFRKPFTQRGLPAMIGPIA